MPFEHGSWRYQARRALLARVVPVYQTASRAKKNLMLHDVLKATGYARPTAIRLLNHPPSDAQTLQHSRGPIYGPEVQQALFLAWKATHYVCAKRLLPSLPTLMEVLEQFGHLRLAEEHRRQVLAMSLSTAERILRTQRKPGLHGLSTTTPGLLRKDQISVRTFSPWQEDRPGFVEIDLVAHCGTHVDGSFLYTLTLTDLATGWTECLPLLYKSADAVLAALAQARVLFPFPLRGIDTDSGSEFLNEALIAYCEQHQLTFTRGRPGFKNEQAHVEQKNRAVVREAVGCVRLEGVQAYHQLREVYRALRLVVNCFQPSLKLQAKVSAGDRVRRMYDVARTTLQRLLASGVLSEAQQENLNGQVQQIDPLILSEHLDALRYALWCGAHLPTAMEASRPLVRFTQTVCLPGLSPASKTEEGPISPQEVSAKHEEILNWPRTTHDPFAGFWEEILALVQAHPEWTGTQIVRGIGHQVSSHLASSPMRTLIHRLHHIRASLRTIWEEPWPTELIQGGAPDRAPVSNQAAPASDQPPALTPIVPDPQPGAGTLDVPGSTTKEHPESGQTAGRTSEARPLAPPTIAQAIAAYLQEMREMGRESKTVQWHQTSLSALQQYLWDQFQFTDVRQLSRAVLQRCLTDLHTTRSPLTKNSLTFLFIRLSQRAGFTTKPICPSMLRDTYAVRFLQAGGELSVLQEQLGLADPASVRRYRRFCEEQQREEPGTQASSGQAKLPRPARRSKSKRRKGRRR